MSVARAHSENRDVGPALGTPLPSGPHSPALLFRLETARNIPGAPGATDVYRDVSGWFSSLPPALPNSPCLSPLSEGLYYCTVPSLFRTAHEITGRTQYPPESALQNCLPGDGYWLGDDGGLWSQHPVGVCEASPGWVRPLQGDGFSPPCPGCVCEPCAFAL